MSESRISVVMFDCDGVLCPFLRFAGVLKREYGITREMTGTFFRENFNSAVTGKVDVLDILPPYLDQWGWKGTSQEFLKLWLESERFTIPEVVAVVEELKAKGIRCGLATNQELNRAKYMRTSMGFEQLFEPEIICISSELGAMKPQHEFYAKATTKADVAPQEILFIDDSLDYLEGAREFGWDTIHFQDVEGLRSEIARRGM